MTHFTPRIPYAVTDVLRDDEPKPGSAIRWAVPQAIELGASGDHLVWSWGAVPPHWTRPGPRMLERFLNLFDASPERVLAFARTWGVLGICEHGLPSSHNPTRDLDVGDVIMGCEGIGEQIGDRWVFREPISAWHRFATEAQEAALLAATLHGHGHVPEPSPQRRITLTLRLWKVLNRWLELGAVKPAIVLHPQWLSVDPETALVPTIGASGLFGALAHRLALACTGVVGFAPCSSCGEWFSPDFTPREGERQWCAKPGCQKAKVAAASRAYRERKQARKQALHNA
jgi:hypothetical protein